MTKRIVQIATVAAISIVAAAIGAGPASAISTQFCEEHGGIAIYEQNGQTTCVGGLGNGLQIINF